MASRHFEVSPGATIRLRVKFYANGVLTDPDSFPADVGLFYVPTGGTAFLTLAPVQEATGVWYVDFTLPLNFSSTVLYDEWTWVGEVGMPQNIQRYKSDIDLLSVPVPPDSTFVASPTDAVGHIFKSVAKTQKAAPKPGFVQKAIPRSVIESVASQSHDRLKSIAKSALEHYIRSFLDTDGENRQAIEAVAKGSLQYITDKSLAATEDKTRRATQLARIYNEIRKDVPAIVIIDAGVESVPTGLMSGLTNATLIDNKWQGWYTKQFKVPMTIAIVTADQESTDQLMELVELQFNNLRQIGGGSAIRSQEPGHNWEVRIPLTQAISATTGENINEDTKDQLWHATFDITVDAEDTFAVEMPFDTALTSTSYDGDIIAGMVPNQPNLSATLPPQILAPSTMQVNVPTTVGFRRLRHTHKIMIDQPMIATIDIDARTITPRRPGTFNLMVMDLAVRQNEAEPRAMAPVVAAQKLITVTL